MSSDAITFRLATVTNKHLSIQIKNSILRAFTANQNQIEKISFLNLPKNGLQWIRATA